MAPKLEALRAPDVGRNIEPAGDGFVIVRPSDADRDVFNDLVRNVVAAAGDEYVALPVTDGGQGYDRVVIVPFNGL